MFEIGRTYKLFISEGSEEEGITEHWNCRAIAVENAGSQV
jgi:hypothetical protein